MAMRWLAAAAFLTVGIVTGCGSSHILYQREGVSRDWTYLDFSRTRRPFVIQAAVGGEHMTFYRVFGFHTDRFTITLTSITGDIFFDVSGEGIRVDPLPDDSSRKKTVAVTAEETVFSIDLSAHPYGEYRLKIEKSLGTPDP